MPPLLFPLDPDNAEPFIEELVYSTTIWTAWSGVEQRRSRRDIPNIRFSFSTLTETARQSGLLQALIWGGQTRQWLVPYWPGARKISADVAEADSLILCDATIYADFGVNRAAMLWESGLRARAYVVTTVGATSIGISPASGEIWLRRNSVVIVPLFLGLVAPTIDVRFDTFNLESAPVAFDLLSAPTLPYELPT